MHPEEYRYSKTHEWAKVEGDLVRVGRGPAGLVRRLPVATVQSEACQQTAELAPKAHGLATWCFAGAGAYGHHIPRAGHCFAPGVLHRLYAL